MNYVGVYRFLAGLPVRQYGGRLRSAIGMVGGLLFPHPHLTAAIRNKDRNMMGALGRYIYKRPTSELFQRPTSELGVKAHQRASDQRPTSELFQRPTSEREIFRKRFNGSYTRRWVPLRRRAFALLGARQSEGLKK